MTSQISLQTILTFLSVIEMPSWSFESVCLSDPFSHTCWTCANGLVAICFCFCKSLVPLGWRQKNGFSSSFKLDAHTHKLFRSIFQDHPDFCILAEKKEHCTLSPFLWWMRNCELEVSSLVLKFLKKWWLVDYIPFGMAYFQWLLLLVSRSVVDVGYGLLGIDGLLGIYRINTHIWILFCFQKTPNKKFPTALRILGPSNGRVNEPV